MSTDLEVKILGLAGDPPMAMRMAVEATGLDLARQMATLRGVPRFQLKLVSADEIVSDSTRMSSLPQPAEVVVVRQTLAEDEQATEELTRAAHTRDVAAVDLALRRPTTPNPPNPCGGASLLAQTAAMGELEIVELLLEAGAEPTGALHFAVQNGHFAVAKRLLQAGVAVDKPVDGEALQLCDEEARKRLRRAGVNIHSVTPLQLAVDESNLDGVTFLLEAGAGTGSQRVFQILVRSNRAHRHETMQALRRSGMKVTCCEVTGTIIREVLYGWLRNTGEYLLLPLVVFSLFLAFFLSHKYESGMITLIPVPIVTFAYGCLLCWRDRINLSIVFFCLPSVMLAFELWCYFTNSSTKVIVEWAVIVFGMLFVLLLGPCFWQLCCRYKYDCRFYRAIFKKAGSGYPMASGPRVGEPDLEEQLSAAVP